MKGPVEKMCEACGATFQCGGYQCWCRRAGITERQMDWIAARSSPRARIRSRVYVPADDVLECAWFETNQST